MQTLLLLSTTIWILLLSTFKDHAFYKYNTDLTMDGQLKFKGKPVIVYIGQPIGSNKGDIGSMTAEEMKRMLNKDWKVL